MNTANLIRLAVLSGLLLLPLLVQGAPVGDLYAAEVVVADDGIGARNRGLAAALGEVLVKLSGRAGINAQPAAAGITAAAASLVQQFRYRTEDTGREPGSTVTYLWARFDKAAVDRRLRAVGLPVWGARRPQVLVWLGRERGGRRALLVPETEQASTGLIMRTAERRGMPVQLPLMDLEDQGALTAADLWASYAEGIEQASVRYPHDAVLTGRLRSVGGGYWSGEWRLREAGQEQAHSASNLRWGDALAAGLNWAQERLAERYAPFAGGDGPERLKVRFWQVDSLTAYRRLMTILASREVVDRIDLQEMEADRVDTHLWVRGGRSALARALMLGGELFELGPEPPAPLPDPAMPLAGSLPVAVPVLAGAAASTPELPPVDLSYRLLQR